MSNWRKRFEDFPRPVESVPGGRDLFELQEVERWLDKRGRLDRAGRGRHLLFQAADLLRLELSAASMTEALGAALALVALGRRRTGSLNGVWDVEAILALVAASDPGLDDLFQPLREIDRRSADRVLGLVLEIDEADLPECFEWLLTRHNQQQGMAEKGSGDIQTALLLALTGGAAGAVYDPAAGLGGFLIALWRAAAGQGRELFGQEVDAAASRLARQRFLVHEIPVSLAAGDTLLDDGWPELRADVVVCDPPYGAKKSWPAGVARDPRWAFGAPPVSTDFAWLQHAAHHLTESGRAYVFLPPGSLFRGGREADLRMQLLAKGTVEAVVSLPPRTSLRTGIPEALWILRRPGGSDDRDPVLLIDATANPPRNRRGFAEHLVPRIASALLGWRAGGELSDRDRELATLVPVSDLMQESANMVPARWINRELTEAQRERQEDDFEQTLAGMDAIRRALGSKLEIARPRGQSAAEWVSVKRLIEQGLVEIVKGTRVKAEDCLPRGVPVLRTRDLAARFGDRVEPCHISLDAMQSPPALTKPGDIVLSPASGPLRAFVDRDGGHVLARPLQALRLRDGFMDPGVVAAFLESPRNRRFVTGAAYARVSLRDLELPLLAPGDAETLRLALEELNGQERQAEELASSARRLRHSLVSLASPVVGEENGDG